VQLLRNKNIAPYIPSAENDNFDAFQANGIDKWNEENLELLKENTLLLRKNSVQDLFEGYYYNYERTLMPETLKHKRPGTAKLEVPKKRRTISLKW
jgi:hypothetical protein